MKLYLSSYRIPTPQDLIALIGKDPAQTKMALIPNSKDYYAERARTFKINVVIDFLKELGFNPDVIDLNDYSQDKLATVLAEYDVVWISGGNTFCLREAMQRSGFDKVLNGLLENGLVYGGDSAGAIVVGPTLKGTETADEPEFAETIIFEGLNIIDKIVIPHADNLSMKESLIPMLELYKDDPNAVVLNDNQALVIADDNVKVVTAITNT